MDGLDLPGPLYVRVRPGTNGRLRVRELYLDASTNDESPIVDDDVRDLPMRQIEALINANAELVHDWLDELGPDLSTLASYYSTGFGRVEEQVKQRHWVLLNYLSQLEPDQLEGLPSFVRVKPKTSRSRARVRETDLDFRLGSGPAEGLTDAFLSDVARAYAAAVARGEHPNKTIAGQTNYPLKSVQRWVYTARQRGIMPRGSKGRAG